MADHPMLALVILNQLNRAQQAGLLDDPGTDGGTRPQMTDGVRRIAQTLGPHPDVLALAGAFPTGRPGRPSDWPTSLAGSLDLLLRNEDRQDGRWRTRGNGRRATADKALPRLICGHVTGCFVCNEIAQRAQPLDRAHALRGN